MSSVVAKIISGLRPIRRPARILYVGTAFWLVSAAVHLGALALDEWQWSGAVSFRKPLVFSLSMGLLLGTVGWILDRLPDRPRLAGTLAWTFLVSSSIEVGLIAMQTWRGRASHFNVFAAGDAAIFAAMGVTVAVMSLCLVGTLVWAAIERPADRLVRLAVIAGMVLVTTGLGIGQWIVDLGAEYAATTGQVPDTVISGERGVAKFPHAVAFHGIQVFIITAVILRAGRLRERVQARLMRLVVWSYAAMLVFATMQTIGGNAPLDISVWSLGQAISLAGVGYGVTRAAMAMADVAGADRQTPLPVP